jgi:uncharacterized protein YbjQ (UPF0145 family)
MLITTTDTLQGIAIDRYLGLVIGQAVVGTHMTKTFARGFHDVTIGTHHDYGEDMGLAREQALGQMRDQAMKLGADAVIGCHLSYQTVGDSATFVMVSAAGTAVKLATAESARAA